MPSKNHPVISIVTPSYNQGKFIEDTIKSVLYQKGDFFIDYLIIDGGSSDKSVDIIQKYEYILKNNCYVFEQCGSKFFKSMNNEFEWNRCTGISYRWVSTKDNGQVDALKKGFNRAMGRIFTWLNSDDIYLNSEVLQTVNNLFIYEPDIKIITSDGIFIDINGNEIGKHQVDEINIKELIYLDYHILQPSTFFLKSIYNPEYLDESLTCAFDAKFFIKLFIANKYKKLDIELSGYRYYSDMKTIALSNRRYAETVSLYKEFSSNYFYQFISGIYRYFEIRKKPFWKKTFVKRFFKLIRHFAYFLILGEKGR